MRLIDADVLKDQLIRAHRIDTVNENAPIGNGKRHTMKIEYKFSFYEIVKLLNQSPTVISGCDADNILDAYGKGYSKGREDALSEAQHIKNYCDNDCNATKEAAVAITKYLYKHEIRKEQKMENSEMTKKEEWDKVIQDLKILDQEAHGEEFVPLVTGLLVMTAEQLHIDAIHSTVKQEDKSHMWGLVNDLGCYSIKGETIMYLPVYQELTTLMRKVFLF